LSFVRWRYNLAISSPYRKWGAPNMSLKNSVATEFGLPAEAILPSYTEHTNGAASDLCSMIGMH
jgi:hypothetical protein